VNVLVLGGTGPTGPYVIDGLLDRGYDVTMMHGGFHEAEFKGPVEDLHGDVHFTDSLEATLADRKFDVVIFMYGRLRLSAEFFMGRTDRFIAVGAAAGRAGRSDPRWGPLGRAFAPNEDNNVPITAADGGIRGRIQAANERVLELHDQGHYNATILAYPNLYGPRQPAPEDWCVVRRILDGRRELIIADGGMKIHQRAYVENAAQAVLLAVDKPKESAGELFVIGEPLYTMRQRVELIARTLNHQLELIDMPFPLARPCHYLWFHSPKHWVRDDSKIRRVLGYTEVVEAGEAQIRTVNWLVENRGALSGEWENQIDDSFDYAAEDDLIAAWRRSCAEMAAIEVDMKPPAHRYRHPKTPGEGWYRPETGGMSTASLDYY
jgi:nucleoside-diphosphate-sugar epimerase